eukprot:TRINITY_DN40939_c0_g1_i1.p1 TRINITY_DN40939_c0_g1~~TRINITY_DN40939_c0_g1_i1.p1  ORF type:complete len:286 (-),score=30.87 TRINITY_DN40939_c0_g1_i1:63-920(-)
MHIDTPPSFSTIELTTHQQQWATLMLNRPEKLNAMTPHMQEEILSALAWLCCRQVKVLLLCAAGQRAFCAGFDTSAWDKDNTVVTDAAKRLGADSLFQAGMSARLAHESTERGYRLALALDEYPGIIICAVHGHCIGGGANLVLCSDLRIAADNLRFVFPEASLGIPLTWGGVNRLVRDVGPVIAKDILLGGRIISATEALRLRVIHRVVPAADLAASATKLAIQLAQIPSGVLQLTKRQSANCRITLCQAWRDAGLHALATLDDESRATADSTRVTRRSSRARL